MVVCSTAGIIKYNPAFCNLSNFPNLRIIDSSYSLFIFMAAPKTPMMKTTKTVKDMKLNILPIN
jgi:hypothetical protein